MTNEERLAFEKMTQTMERLCATMRRVSIAVGEATENLAAATKTWPNANLKPIRPRK